MTTVADIDKKIEEIKQRLAQEQARKRAFIAKQRELERQWREESAFALGESILAAFGSDWTQFDFDTFQAWLDKEFPASTFLIEPRSADDAHAALSEWRKACAKK